MNPSLAHLLTQPWTVRQRRAGDLCEICVVAADGRPICTAGVLCGHQRADALTAAVAGALAALPVLVGALRQLADLRDTGNGPAVRGHVRDLARAALQALAAPD